jgi:hypothetical protein
MRFFICLTASLIAAIGVSTASAGPVFMDDFESYADTPAMTIVWAGSVGSLDTAVGNPGQSMLHPGGASRTHGIPGTNPTDLRPLIWKFDFLDDGVGNKRLTGALRDVGGSAAGNQAFFEMGRYNAIGQPEGGPNVSGYGIRHAFVGGIPAGAGGWMTYVGNPGVQTGWHQFIATIGDTFATFDLDLQKDGIIDGSRTITIAAAGKVYNLLRFGGPSDVSSPGGGGNFDNVMVSVVPEPASLALVALAMTALALGGRRRSA